MNPLHPVCVVFDARKARSAVYQLPSLKERILGETERKTRLHMLELFDWTPNVVFVDEIIDALPSERNDKEASCK